MVFRWSCLPDGLVPDGFVEDSRHGQYESEIRDDDVFHDVSS